MEADFRIWDLAFVAIVQVESDFIFSKSCIIHIDDSLGIHNCEILNG